jgi:hypothetical protein
MLTRIRKRESPEGCFCRDKHMEKPDGREKSKQRKGGRGKRGERDIK